MTCPSAIVSALYHEGVLRVAGYGWEGSEREDVNLKRAIETLIQRKDFFSLRFDPLPVTVRLHLQETFSDVVKTDKTGLSKTAHTRWMISAFANFLPGSTIFRLA